MELRAATIQMTCQPSRVADNLERADDGLRQARDQGAELIVLPEMFNTGYGSQPDYGVLAEDDQGPSLRFLRERSQQWKLAIAAGFVEHRAGHLYDALAFCRPDGHLAIYRKRHLVFWECRRFRQGRQPLIVDSPWGRVGFAICADMIYRRVWRGYRNQIDVAIVSAAWPDFANRHTGRPHWLYGGLGPLSGEIPRIVAHDLGVPVIFANQCGETETRVPLMPRIPDRFAGRSTLCDGRGLPVRAGADEAVLTATLQVAPNVRGELPCRSTSRSVTVDWSSMSAAC